MADEPLEPLDRMREQARKCVAYFDRVLGEHGKDVIAVYDRGAIFLAARGAHAYEIQKLIESNKPTIKFEKAKP